VKKCETEIQKRNMEETVEKNKVEESKMQVFTGCTKMNSLCSHTVHFIECINATTVNLYKLLKLWNVRYMHV
jgi:hypothetical protein